LHCNGMNGETDKSHKNQLVHNNTGRSAAYTT